MPSFYIRLLGACIALFAVAFLYPQPKSAGAAPSFFPEEETLSYSVEWRLIYAGSARLNFAQAAGGDAGSSGRVHLETGGVVSKFYKLNDEYSAEFAKGFCTTLTNLEAQEGKKRYSTRVLYDQKRGEAKYLERDLIKNAEVKSANVQIPACASDMIGSLLKLRTLHLEPGQSTQMPVSDGKKSAMGRLEAQEREQIQTKAGTFKTMRYESYVFNGVLYARKARLLIWISEDARRLPVQIQCRLPFPIGTITLQLDKEEHSPVASTASMLQ